MRFLVSAFIDNATIPKVRNTLELMKPKIKKYRMKRLQAYGKPYIRFSGVFTSSVKPTSIKTMLGKTGHVSWFSAISSARLVNHYLKQASF